MAQKDIRLQGEQKDSYYSYNTNNQIGEGQFGKVYQCKKFNKINDAFVQDNNSYAIKIVKFLGSEQADIQRELDIVQKIRGDYICKIFYAAKVAKPPIEGIYIVSEYCDQGTLKQYCQKYKPSLKQIIEIFWKLLKGYKESLHDKDIMHRDIKPDNILMKNDDPKICDFGLGKISQQLQEKVEQTYKCSPLYGSPQIVRGDCVYSYKTDIYSFGVLLYTLTNDNNPNFLKSLPQLYQFLDGLKITPIESHLKFKNENLPQDIKNLIYGMMQYEEQNRFDIVNLLIEVEKIRKNFDLNGQYNSQKKENPQINRGFTHGEMGNHNDQKQNNPIFNARNSKEAIRNINGQQSARFHTDTIHEYLKDLNDPQQKQNNQIPQQPKPHPQQQNNYQQNQPQQEKKEKPIDLNNQQQQAQQQFNFQQQLNVKVENPHFYSDQGPNNKQNRENQFPKQQQQNQTPKQTNNDLANQFQYFSPQNQQIQRNQQQYNQQQTQPPLNQNNQSFNANKNQQQQQSFPNQKQFEGLQQQFNNLNLNQGGMQFPQNGYQPQNAQQVNKQQMNQQQNQQQPFQSQQQLINQSNFQFQQQQKQQQQQPQQYQPQQYQYKPQQQQQYYQFNQPQPQQAQFYNPQNQQIDFYNTIPKNK